MDTFDRLHVVSDLHLGGSPGRQIMNQGEALARVIDWLTARDRRERVGLVLNGDVIDFLLVDDAKFLDPHGAEQKLLAVMAEPAFAPVFQALARFVATEGRTLVVAMGNHDVELGLPHVEARLVAALSNDDAAARARIVMVTSGEGYACRVGGDRVLCVHGNELDSWNVVDHEALRRVARALNRGVAPEPWEPNAGTRLVIDVVNGIKRRYPFVDLLKPQSIAVPQVLLALPADYKTSLAGFAKCVGRKVVDAGLLHGGFLSAGGDEDPHKALDEMIASGPLPTSAAPDPAMADPLAHAADLLQRGAQPTDLVGATGERKLGIGGLLVDRLYGRDPRENLRKALTAYASGDTFALDGKDPGFDELDRTVGHDVRFIVSGHTHLERRKVRHGGRGVYYNSGTWIRLIQITEPMLRDDACFNPYFEALTAGTLDALDAADGPGGKLVIQRGTVVSIVARPNGGARGELCHAAGPGGSAAEPPWTVVPKSGYPEVS